VHGESSRDPVFREVVEKAVEGISDEILVPVYADDPVFVAGKGAAELGRRALAGRKGEEGFGELWFDTASKQRRSCQFLLS
jgi:hypothetical protein